MAGRAHSLAFHREKQHLLVGARENRAMGDDRPEQYTELRHCGSKGTNK